LEINFFEKNSKEDTGVRNESFKEVRLVMRKIKGSFADISVEEELR
jgi:hypothetical protein